MVKREFITTSKSILGGRNFKMHYISHQNGDCFEIITIMRSFTPTQRIVIVSPIALWFILLSGPDLVLSAPPFITMALYLPLPTLIPPLSHKSPFIIFSSIVFPCYAFSYLLVDTIYILIFLKMLRDPETHSLIGL